MRAYHAVGGWTYWAAACGLTLLSTGCYSAGSGWSAPKFSSLNPFAWGQSSAAVADQRGGPQLPSSASTPAYPRTSQSGLPQSPGGNNYGTGIYSMSGNGNPAPGGTPNAGPSGPSAGPGGVAVTPPVGTNQGFYNENAYGAGGGNAPTQPVTYTSDARGQFGPAAPANFESRPASPPNSFGPPATPEWPSNPAPTGGFPNPSFDNTPPAAQPNQPWPNAPVNSTPAEPPANSFGPPANSFGPPPGNFAPPAAPAWNGGGATNLPAESAPGTNPAAPPAGAPGFNDSTSATPSFGPPAGVSAPPSTPSAPPTMTYLGDSPAPGNMIGSLPPPVAPPGGSVSPQHRTDPGYRPGATKNYLPATPATFERPASNVAWPNAPGS